MGKPQTISTFEGHHGAPPTQIQLPTLPLNVYTNFPVTQMADSVNVLLRDALNTPTRDRTYVHSQMIKYLKTIPSLFNCVQRFVLILNHHTQTLVHSWL